MGLHIICGQLSGEEAEEEIWRQRDVVGRNAGRR
jgi:hypothetical protein